MNDSIPPSNPTSNNLNIGQSLNEDSRPSDFFSPIPATIVAIHLKKMWDLGLNPILRDGKNQYGVWAFAFFCKDSVLSKEEEGRRRKNNNKIIVNNRKIKREKKEEEGIIIGGREKKEEEEKEKKNNNN